MQNSLLYWLLLVQEHVSNKTARRASGQLHYLLFIDNSGLVVVEYEPLVVVARVADVVSLVHAHPAVRNDRSELVLIGSLHSC